MLTSYPLYIFETVMNVKTNRLVGHTNNHGYNNRFNRPVEKHSLKLFEGKASFMGAKFFLALPRNISLGIN